MPPKLTRRFVFGQDVSLLRDKGDANSLVVGIATDDHGERGICYVGKSVLLARAYMSSDKDATVYMMTGVEWFVVENEERSKSDGDGQQQA